MKRIAVLGSTGSIGASALDVIASHPESLSLIGLSARSRIESLQEQIARHHPRLVAVLEKDQAQELKRRTAGSVEVLAGTDGLVRLASHPDVDVVLIGTSGPDALRPLLAAIEAHKQIALASKELLVMAGALIMRMVREHGVHLVPVDSEHAALFQALQGVAREDVDRIVITGSGGPLWFWSREQVARATREQVLNHPKWQMGPKITVDSATLMNKGLEIIEAHWLFDMPLDRIRVVIHPQALIHAIVELRDGTCLAQMSICDMRLPIQYALSFPQRWPSALPRLSLTDDTAHFQFFEPDPERFPCLRLAQEAARMGGTACTALSAANDIAVWAFLRDELSFGDIPRVIQEAMAQHQPVASPSLEDILACDRWARHMAQRLIHHGARVSVS